MDTIKEYLEMSEKLLDNSLVSGAVVVFFILFGGFLAPDLPHSLVKVFAHPLIKIIFVLAILLLRKYSVTASVLLTIIFILLVQAVTKFSVERIAQKVQNDMEKAYKETTKALAQNQDQNAQSQDQNAQSAQSEGQGQKIIGQYLNPADPAPANADPERGLYSQIPSTDTLAKEIQELNPVYPAYPVNPTKYGAFSAN